MRKAHWLRPANSSRLPSNIIVVDTETHCSNESTDKIAYHTLTLGYAMKYRLESGKRTRKKDLFFYDTDTFWDFVEKHTDKQRTTYVFGHNLGYDLGILDAWYTFRQERWGFYRIAVERNIVYIDGTLNGHHIVFVDTANYWKMSLDKIGKQLGRKKMSLPDTSKVSEELKDRCRVDVEITAEAIDSLINWIDVNDYGPFGVSAASLAMNTFRKKYMKDNILVHDNEQALKLERRGYYGGAVDTPFIGMVKDSPIYECDIVSMYPSCCMRSLPTILRDVRFFVPLSQIPELCERYMVIADVKLNTDTPMYPKKTKHQGTIYPIGKFATTLADAEFRYAYDHNHIETVDMIAIYESAPIFKEYMEHFVGEKIKAKDKDKMKEGLCKLMVNSLYGKTGQLTPRWFDINERNIEYAEHYYDLPKGYLQFMLKNPPTIEGYEKTLVCGNMGVYIPLRQLWQNVEIQIGEQETRDSTPAIAACVTSPARLLLRNGQRVAQAGNWFYGDTDSCWCNERGLSNLCSSGMVGNECGMFQVKGKCEGLVVFGKKDYIAYNYVETGKDRPDPDKPHIIKRKGIREKAKQVTHNTWEQEKWSQPISQIKSGLRGKVVVELVEKTLSRDINHCLVMPSGKTLPLHGEVLQ